MNKSLTLISAFAISLLSIGCSTEFETVCSTTSEPQKCRGDDDCLGVQVCDADGFWLACDCQSEVEVEVQSEMVSSFDEDSAGSIQNSAEETPVAETPAGEMPVGETPVGETPVDDSNDRQNCVPKTCAQITFELTDNLVDDGLIGSACGVHDDGCGSVTICDACDGDNRKCGGNSVVPQGSRPLFSQEGVCGGGCTEAPTNNSWCSSMPFTVNKAYRCGEAFDEDNRFTMPQEILDKEHKYCLQSLDVDGAICCEI